MGTKLLWVGADVVVTDVNFRRALAGVEIDAANCLDAATLSLRSTTYSVALVSVESLNCSPDHALDTISRLAPDVPVIVYHRNGTVDDVIHFTRLGAFYVVVGELTAHCLIQQITKIETAIDLRTSRNFDPWRTFLVGESRPMLQIREIIQLVAAKRCTILISGETGTGKEVVAKAIHAASNRASLPMVSMNCSALAANLIETELFGHTKGAFTGAHTSRIGRFEQAHRSSIFLDEIGDLPIEAQAKLLRVLQEQELQRVGSSETVHVDVRVIAASNVDLLGAIREKRFREDLYYRLNVVPIHLPPLRHRRDDIPCLLQFFLEKIRVAEGGPPKHISDEAVSYLQQENWPGNIRQLEHAVHMACALSGDRCILTPADFRTRQPMQRLDSVEPLPSSHKFEVPREGINFDEVVSRLELSLLDQALKLSSGNKARAADLLGIKRTTLLAKMKALDYEDTQPKASSTGKISTSV